MIRITDRLSLADDEVKISAIRARGAGGQNVNKVSSAIHLRFDIPASSLPAEVKTRLLESRDSRINSEGVVIIKAQNHRSQDKNRSDAIDRLRRLIADALEVPRKRVPTRPGRAAKERRLETKKRRSRLKQLRSKSFD